MHELLGEGQMKRDDRWTPRYTPSWSSDVATNGGDEATKLHETTDSTERARKSSITISLGLKLRLQRWMAVT